MTKYYWIRIYDFHYDEDQNRWDDGAKGTMLDEYYLCGQELTREDCKKQVVERSGIKCFAKPRKKDGVYAIVMDSDKFFYDRFTVTIDTLCFNCGAHIQGHAKDFPHISIESNNIDSTEISVGDIALTDTKYYFCSYDCKKETYDKLHAPEGEWQEREGYDKNGGVYGYIYHIYNRKTNMHYIGQTIYMPFFRWQEHVKANIKGNICDLVFETVTEVRNKDQQYLNNIEAWWIQKYIEEYGKEHVMNITVPHITIDSLVDRFNRMVYGVQKIGNSI